MTTDNREVEIKLPVDRDSGAMSGWLSSAGFQISKPRIFESNVLFDTSDGKLRESAELVRLRRVGSDCIMTYKGRPVPGKHKSREELETSIGDAAAMQSILARLGFGPVFCYEKFRTEYQAPGQDGVVTLDETPIGVFLEIEGKPDWIDQVAHSLGFSEQQYITKSYGGLYYDYCRTRGISPTNMVFATGTNRG